MNAQQPKQSPSQSVDHVEKEADTNKDPAPVSSEATHASATPKQSENGNDTSGSTPARSSAHRWLILVGVLILLGAGLIFPLYQLPVDHPYVQQVGTAIPFPAMNVDGKTVSIEQYLQYRETIIANNASDIEESPSQDIEPLVNDTIVGLVILQRAADERGIEVTDEALSEATISLFGGMDEEVIREQVSEMYGWPLSEFEQRVILPVVLTGRVNTQMAKNEELQSHRKQTAEEARERMINEDTMKDVLAWIGEEIEQPQYAQNPSLGDFGPISRSSLPDDIGEAVDEQEIGEVGSLIETNETFSFFIVTSRMDAGEDTELELRAIHVPKRTVSDLLSEEKEAADVSVYVKPAV